MEETHKTTKLQFITTDELWNTVLKYKIERGLKNNNEAVEELIKKSITGTEKTQPIISEEPLPDDVLKEIEDFRNKLPIIEKKKGLPLLILKDKKSNSYYTECHIKSEELIELADTNSIIDPEIEEELRANRELEKDNYYYEQMLLDAKKGRQFSDIVIEYNTEYTSTKPLKVLGGQHRTEAIKESLKDKVNVTHGIRVYFYLKKEQREEIMRIANTNINVATDLRDRLREEILEPSGMLKKFCNDVGILEKGDNFGDKRRYDEDFSPTVRMVRSFIVNYFKGKEYKGDIDNDAVMPYLCKSGKDIDKEYIKYFNKFKSTGFNDKDLIEAGKNFAKLHDKQFKTAENLKHSSKKEFKLKAFSLSIVTSWAFTAGVLHNNPERLKKLYDLPDLSGTDDPLNALAMQKAKHKDLDSDSYRGLGTRSDDKERGRLLQLFLAYSLSPKPKITEPMCNSAIEIFHSNLSRKKAEESRKRAFE